LEARRPSGLERLTEKAQKLVEQGRVYRTEPDQYGVIGDHGTYTVVRTPDDRLHCNCQGFLQRGRCSHIAAVLLFESQKRVRKEKKEGEWWKTSWGYEGS